MNITELRYLVAIMKWGSVSAAAKQMYAAQPNVSKALKNLEEEYGIRIFERSSTGMIPTEQGRHFIEQAQRVLQEVDRLDADARRRQGECAELRVALPHATYASYAAVDFLQQAAGSEQLRVATAIVRCLKPQCGFVLLDKLVQMDLGTLREFGAWLESEGLQAIATRVSTGDECSIIIEDGYVQGEEQPLPDEPQSTLKAGAF